MNNNDTKNTNTNVCWLSRPSICWMAEEATKEEERNINKNDDTDNDVDDNTSIDHNNNLFGCCYWNRDVIDAIQKVSILDDKDKEEEEVNEDIINASNNNNNVSYANLIFISSLIVCELRKQLRNEFCCSLQQNIINQTNKNNNGNNNKTIVIGVPIVVAIPEGPFLPLATLVVHALNLPFEIDIDINIDDSSETKKSSIIKKKIKLSTIFVPIEPSEAKQRNIDILNDVRPIKILTIPGGCSEDYKNLQNIVTASSSDTAKQQQQQQQQHIIRNYEANNNGHPYYYMMQSSDTSNNNNSELVKFDELIISVLSSKASTTTKFKNDFKSLLLDPRLAANIDNNNNNNNIQTLVCICSDYCDYYFRHNNDDNNVVNNNNSNIHIQRTPPSPDIFLEQYFDDDECSNQHQQKQQQQQQHEQHPNRISHIVFTSGTTGRPKGCVSSIKSLQHYITSKNEAHGIITTTIGRRRRNSTIVVLLASSLSFDPCFSDIIATFQAYATLAIAPRSKLLSGLPSILQNLKVTHILCTPTLWSLVGDSSSSSSSSSRDGNDSSNNNLLRPYYKEFPFLQVIALGGEKIPYPMQIRWARTRKEARKGEGHDDDDDDDDNDNTASERCRLFATYGVTEACVYQTFGEILINSDDDDDDDDHDDPPPTLQVSEEGQFVGKPLRGISIRICDETIQDTLVDIETTTTISSPSCRRHQQQQVQIGEVIIFGNQCDEFTNYLNRPELQYKFISSSKPSSNSDGPKQYYYRTGDRGILNIVDGTLRIVGRIVGEEGMVKINGVRVELGEIESAVIDDITTTPCTSSSLVTNCCARYIDGNANNERSSGRRSEIQVFCILSDISLAELGIKSNTNNTVNGRIVTGGPLLELLRARCLRRLKAACMPTSFVIISRLPVGATGKRDRNGLPILEDCIAMDGGDDQAQTPRQLLKEYGIAGGIVAEKIIDCLNLQPSQEGMVTTSVTFSMLGGDSLAATRVTRSLYAYHHQVNDNRFLGGQFGKLDGPFDVIFLLRAKTLGEYVDMLDKNGIGVHRQQHQQQGKGLVVESSTQTKAEPSREVQSEEVEKQSRLYDALLQATTLDHFAVAIALLDVGTDPNFGQHGGRLGKVSGRRQQKALFRSSPLHLACLKGRPQLVRKLLEKDAKPNTPDASGLFPLHLAASGMDGESYNEAEDLRRLECVKALFAAGVPIKMRDGNKQSVLHAAARAGHSQLLRQVMTKLDEEFGDGNGVNRYFQWTDRWCRTPVHWAVLNNRKEALSVLLELGCNPDPPQPKVNNRSSAAVESPMELCDRLYGTEATGKGSDIRALLLASMASKKR